MAGQFPAPPTYAEVVLVDEQTKKFQFNPIWLRFFLDIVAVLNGSGGSGGTSQHNNLIGLQGGSANQYYHLTLTEYSNLTGSGAHNTLTGLQGGTASEYYHLTNSQHGLLTGGVSSNATTLHQHRDQIAVSNITPSGSPYTYQNTSDYDADIIVQGGTVSLVEFTRDNVNFYNVGTVAGMFHLGPDDRLRVTYTVAPTMRYIQG